MMDGNECNILPGTPEFKNADGHSWGNNTTPTVISVIPSLGSYVRGFPKIKVYAKEGAILVLECNSAHSVAGWEYEIEPGTWKPLTPAGIPASVVNGVNRMRYTIQQQDALTPEKKYIITGLMGGAKK